MLQWLDTLSSHVRAILDGVGAPIRVARNSRSHGLRSNSCKGRLANERNFLADPDAWAIIHDSLMAIDIARLADLACTEKIIVWVGNAQEFAAAIDEFDIDHACSSLHHKPTLAMATCERSSNGRSEAAGPSKILRRCHTTGAIACKMFTALD